MSGNSGNHWRRASELPPQHARLEASENANTINNRHSTGGFGQSQKNSKRVLATTTATAVTTMSKRRMSMRNRRVSFAPDPELTTIREFEKEEQANSPVGDDTHVGGHKVAVQQRQQLEQLPEGEPMMISPVQQPVSGQYVSYVSNGHGRVSFGDITAGLPTLGELVEEEEEEAGGFGGQGMTMANAMGHGHDDVTRQVPGLGALLEEEDLLAGEKAQKEQSEVQHAPNPSKWGFVPGNDDTLDVDLKGHGRLFMGDTTFSKMYAENVTANSLASVDAATSLASAEKSVQHVERVSFGGGGGNGQSAVAHPALEQSSPNFTDSSMGTASTRRVSVDARRMSVSSRRVSMMGAAVGAGGAGVVAVKETANGVKQNHHAADDDDEEDLLADDSPRSMNVKTFDVLAGLKNRMSALSPPKQSRRSSMLPVPEDMELPVGPFHSPSASGVDRRQSVLSVGNGNGNVRRSFGTSGNPRESIGVSMGRTPPGSITRRTSLNTLNTGGTTVIIGGMQNAVAQANVTNMTTPMRTNALVSNVNPANSVSVAPPGSAIAARYPGSAVATGRMSQGFTPSNLPPITFQDFAKIVEVQFLDNLRRGASINYADLQPNPVPSNVKESLSLLCITQPNIEELETAISTLQSEIQRLRGSAADLEVMLGQTNPAIFRHVQTSSYEQLEALRNNVASLKKACRAKATALLKDVRCQMEESKHGRLCRALDGLKADVAWFHQVQKYQDGISKAAAKFIAEKREYMASKRSELAARAEKVERLRAARKAVADIVAANRAREEQLTIIESSANNMDSELTQIEAERAELEAEIEQGRAIVQNASASVAKARQSFSTAKQAEEFLLADDETVADKLNQLKLYEKCTGMKIESCRAPLQGAFACSINVADAFLMELNYANGSDGVTIVVRPRGPRSEFAMRLFSQRDSRSFSCERQALACVTQALVGQMTLAANAAKELAGIRADCRNICELTPVSAQYDAMGQRSRMAVRIGCLGVQLGVRFSVTLSVKDLSCLGVDVAFGGDLVGEEKIRGALVSEPHGGGVGWGLGAVCGALCGVLAV